MLDGEKIFIEKNKHRYRLFITTNEVTLDILKELKKSLNKSLEAIIVVTNKDFTKEQTAFIKENNFYSISRPGLINIFQLLENKLNEEEENKEIEKENKKIDDEKMEEEK